METYSFKLHQFHNDDLSEDELEMKMEGCVEAARQEWPNADVSLTGSTLSVSVSSVSELTAADCKEKFKRILQRDSITIGATLLF